jgi:hypothetical protein
MLFHPDEEQARLEAAVSMRWPPRPQLTLKESAKFWSSRQKLGTS